MKPSPGAERDVGIGWYATDAPPCAALARESAEDFIVEEKISVPDLSQEPRTGYLPLYRVHKRSIDTMHMARELSSELRSRVSYGGLKDSRASSVQYVTPTSLRSAAPERVRRDRFSADLVGWVPRPLTRGSVAGNRFVIALRGCCDEIGARIEDAFVAARDGRVPNYFGLQRFGLSGAGTHLVGKAMVRRDFEGAVELLLGRAPGMRDIHPSGVGALRSAGDAEEAVEKEIARRPGEWIGALRAVPLKLRRLYVQAYQSYIFNRSLSGALRAGEDVSAYVRGDNWAEVSEDGISTTYAKSAKATPTGRVTPLMQLVGFAYRDYGSRFDRHVGKTLQEEGVSPGQFFVEEMQEVSAEGGFRQPHLALAEGSWKVEGEVARLAFTLPRGQYATVLLREMLKPEDPVGSGLV